MRIFLIAVFMMFTTGLNAQGFVDTLRRNAPQPPVNVPFNPLQPNNGGGGGGGGLAPPGVAGCSVDQFLAPLKAAEKLVETQADQLKVQAEALKNAAEQLRQANEQLRNAATNAAQGQLDLIKKAVEESAKLLVNPVETVVNGIKTTVKKYYDDIVNTIQEWALKLVVLAGIVLGLGVAWPFAAFLRAITPGGK